VAITRNLFLPVFVIFLLHTSARAEVTRIEIDRRLPYAGGREFDGVGAYERMLGRVYFEIDPEHPANGRIVDLELAPRNARGRVEFSADLEILAPVDLSRARGTLLYDVNNRGNRLALGQFNTGADHFLMRHGYVVVWSGWIAQVLPGGDRLRLTAPEATHNGQPITGLVRAEMVADDETDRMTIAQWANQGSYEPTERGEREATLTWRLRETDPRVSIPRAQWRLEKRWIEADGQRGQMPLVELVLSGGFQPGYIYELIYEAQGPLVQGTGLAGIRDLISFLRYDDTAANPLIGDNGSPVVQRTLGFGVSQSGRCLRMLVYDGFNTDETGRIVFDGLIPHVAGAGLGFFNHRFASPTRHNGQHDNHAYPADVFPFTYGEETDPFTGRSESILTRARSSGSVPRIMHTQTSAEYWHRAGSLTHTDPTGSHDAPVPPEVRIYAIGGAQHGPGGGLPSSRNKGQLPANPTDYRPLMRALLAALDEWIGDDRQPPQSVYPRLSDGTLVGWQQESSGWSPLPGVRYPEVIHRPGYHDYGPAFLTERRITVHPPRRVGVYQVLVPAYDADNNEGGMLRLPSVAAPVATYTGWNLRDRSIGAEHELLGLTGAFIPLVRSARERQAAGDPRPALLERYRDFDDYVSQFTRATDALIEARYLLSEDRPRLIDLARKHRRVFEME